MMNQEWQPIDSVPRNRQVLMMQSDGRRDLREVDEGVNMEIMRRNYTHWMELPDPPPLHKTRFKEWLETLPTNGGYYVASPDAADICKSTGSVSYLLAKAAFEAGYQVGKGEQ